MGAIFASLCDKRIERTNSDFEDTTMTPSTELEHDAVGKRRDEEPKAGAVDEKNEQLVGLDESYTEEEERAVLRKIDCTILPMVCSDHSNSANEGAS